MFSPLCRALLALIACSSAACAESAIEPMAPRDAAASVSVVVDAEVASPGDDVPWPPRYVPFDGGAAPADAAVALARDAGSAGGNTAAPDASSVVDAAPAPARDASSPPAPDASSLTTPDAALCSLDPCVGHCPGTTPCCMPSGRCACLGLLGCGLPPL